MSKKRSKSQLSKKSRNTQHSGANSEEEDYDDYDGQMKQQKQRAYINRLRQQELKDIRFGNTKTKVVSFHKGQNTIHEADREKGTSIMANLNLSKKGFKKGENPFRKLKDDQPIKLDPKSMLKLGQVTEEQAHTENELHLKREKSKKEPKIDL